MNIVGIIPARYASTRFPGKPLAFIAGKFLIQRVVEQCQKAQCLSEVMVATDDARIAEVAGRFCRVVHDQCGCSDARLARRSLRA